MVTGQPTAPGQNRGCTHDAFVYDSDEMLLSGAVPFLQAGLDCDDTVVVVCSYRKNALLAAALGNDPRVRFLTQRSVYQRPPGALATYQELLERERRRPGRVRLVGEVPYPDGPQERDGWFRYEAVLNRMLTPYPAWVVCGYDTRELAPDVLVACELTHPSLFKESASTPNPLYQEPEEYLRRPAPLPDPVQETSPALRVDDLEDLRALRDGLRVCYDGRAADVPGARDLLTAVDEVPTNALRHGAPPVSVRLWTTPDRSVCTVTDRGEGFDDPVTGYLLSNASAPLSGGAGLWLARSLCDQVEFVREPAGFTVRLTVHH